MILDGVVGSLRQNLGHFSPFPSIKEKQQIQKPFLLTRPIRFINIGVKMVVPTLSALFSNAVGNELSDKGPSFCTILFNNMQQCLILMFSPLFFSEHQIFIISIERYHFMFWFFLCANLMLSLHVIFLIVFRLWMLLNKLGRTHCNSKRFYLSFLLVLTVILCQTFFIYQVIKPH